MAEYLIQEETLTDIADAIRTKTGGTATLTPEEMASTLNNIPNRNSSNLTASGATVTVPAGHYASQATKSVATATRANTTISTTADDTNDKLTITASNNQSTGYVTGANKTATKTITLTTSGATATMSDGTNSVSRSVTTATRAGTTISTTADDTNDKLTFTASNNQSTGYVTGSNQTATKTVTLTASGATVTASDGSKSVSKSVATATQATPSISVSNAGLITASATQSAGYVSAGTKSATKQMTVQAAKTVTPTKSSQTAVASGVYTTGAITVAAIPDTYENVDTLADQLYESLQYSGLVSEDMDLDEICDALATAYPETIFDFRETTVSDWTVVPRMSQDTPPIVSVGTSISFKAFKMAADDSWVDFVSPPFFPENGSHLVYQGTFQCYSGGYIASMVLLSGTSTYYTIANIGPTTPSSFNNSVDLSAFAGTSCVLYIVLHNGWKYSNSDYTLMTFNELKVTR